MKIRNGFVSNSSSSSFVVIGEDTVVSTAINMIPAREWGPRDTKLINILRSYKGSPNTPIAFSSCNYNTFIKKVKGTIFVETCNNHEWHYLIDYRPPTDEELKLIGSEDRDYDAFRVQNLGNFWWPEFGIKACTLWPKYDWCKDCFTDILRLEKTGKEICPKCKKDRKEVGEHFTKGETK